MPESGYFPPPLALTIPSKATLTASGMSPQVAVSPSTSAANRGSPTNVLESVEGAVLVAVESRLPSFALAYSRDDGVECSGIDAPLGPSKQGLFAVPLAYSRAVAEVHPRGFEPVTFGSVDRCSIQLSYGCRAIAGDPFADLSS